MKMLTQTVGFSLALWPVRYQVVVPVDAFAGLRIVAGSVFLIGMFIDAIPAIIILGIVLWPLAEASQMHPIHFAIIGVISLAFGLVTPPYGLCLLIACKVGDIEVKKALRDVAIVLCPMLVVLLIVIFFPALILALPKMLMAKFV